MKKEILYYIETETQEIQNYDFEFLIWSGGARKVMCYAHIHPAIEILFIRQGKCKITLNDIEISASEGDMILCRSNVIHKIISTEKIVYDVLKINPSLIYDFFLGEKGLASYFLTNSNKSHILFKKDDISITEITDIWHKIEKIYDDKNHLYMLDLKFQAAQLLLAILRLFPSDKDDISLLQNNETVAKINTVISYIDEHFSEKINPTDCAKMIYMSYSHFARCFRNVTGLSFKQYLTTIRISKAENLLISSNSSITQIALLCGYESCSYFTQEFKKYKNYTPQAFRKNARSSIQER